MKIAYDPEVDALSIVFRDTTVTTKHLGEGIAVDVDESGHMVGIEVLDVRRRFGERNIFEQVVLQGIAPAA